MTGVDAPATGVVAVTGASGYVGGLVVRRYLDSGWKVVALQRNTTAEGLASSTRRFALDEPLSPGLLDGIDVLIHCAYDLTLTDPQDIERLNVGGTKRLFEAAKAAGVGRIILISSMSAYWGTDQVYGGAKLSCEEATSEVGGISVRLGLVYGSGWGGMAGSLRKLVELPVTPLVGGRSYQYTVHEDDVAEGLYALGAAAAAPTGVLGLASPERVGFKPLLEAFGRQAGARPRFVPVPWRMVYQAMRVAERAGVTLPMRSDSLLGLVRPAGFVPSVDAWAALGVTLRPFGL